jgi:hypothetical protein
MFSGTSISFYGSINNGTVGQVMNASMTIDGGPPVFFVPPIQTAAVTANNLIFNSGDLSDGTHNLVVTAENNNTVWADYFLVTPNPPSASAPSGSTSTSTSIPHSSRKSTLIAASSVGAVLLLTVFVGLLFFLRRRRRRREEFEPSLRKPSILSLAHTQYSSISSLVPMEHVLEPFPLSAMQTSFMKSRDAPGTPLPSTTLVESVRRAPTTVPPRKLANGAGQLNRAGSERDDASPPRYE